MTVLSKPRRVLAVLLLAAGPSVAPAAAQQADAGGARAEAHAHGPAEAAALERGRTLTRLLLAGAVDSLYPQLGEQLQGAVGGRDGLAAFAAGVSPQLGVEVEVADESAFLLGDVVAYHRTARFASAGPGTITVQWTWRRDGVVIAANVGPTQPPAPTEHADYRPRAELRLPFEGEWTVVWGGRTVAENYHAAHRDQRFAYDLLVVRDGSSHAGAGRANEDYHCFGLPILAPAAGRIAAAVDGVADNVPGVMNPAVPPGNHVVIDHGHGERSLLAHLREGSVAVAEGDEVRPGQRIGVCGNSGNSSEPHLHYHLQTGAAFGAGVGLPVWFHDYVADGEPVAEGEPVRGQRIRPAQGR